MPSSVGAVSMFDGLSRPLLMAHRGASRYAPENTLEAFDLAMRVGAQVLEMDVRLTRDREVVVIHDATVARTTNGTGPVASLSAAELLRLDAGHNFEANGETLFRDGGCIVPRLEDVLKAFPNAGFNIEIKDRGMAREVLDVLHRIGPQNVVLAAADDDVMAELVTFEPSCPRSLCRGEVKGFLVDAYRGRSLQRFRGRALQIPVRHHRFAWSLLPVATRRVIDAAHAAGIEVHLWTVNDPKEASDWIARGVDGIFTDDPSALHEVFASRW
ncbi:MAG: hypothetical protein A2341_03355 [Deltaproteobacteria bacterium RIFOXYB12_FULL_58_9]|nr:MAG: hypothetical protein A2341_03355 [Deltaproteobacteria bacterium RIFOXYB12_FULL_58_9]